MNKPRRRDFLSMITGGLLTLPAYLFLKDRPANFFLTENIDKPLVISTWRHGLDANRKAIEVFQGSGSVLDAVEKGVRVVEGDPENSSVGIGGMPDRDGVVTLDACIMDSGGNCGSVCFLKHIKHPISVARKVMEDTPHVMLAGEGALQFALSKGFQKEELLTQKAKQAWEMWKKESKYQPVINIENHDTIGMLGMDTNGDMAGSCTTSGLAYKMHGRVGDSPIIGSGLYVDNEVGGAVATGLGEEVIKKVASFLVVELMRNGADPESACKEAITRIAKGKISPAFQVGLIAIRKDGKYGGYAIHKGFNYALSKGNKHQLIDAPSLF